MFRSALALAKRLHFAIALGAGASLTSLDAHAQLDATQCRVTISIDSALGAQWVEATAKLRADLATRDDCALIALQIVADGNGARLIATTVDGKRAERNVARVWSLRSLAIGLVTSIPSETFAPQPVEESTSRLETPPDEPMFPPQPRTIPMRPKPRLVGAAIVGGRLGMPTRVIATELTLRADIFVDDWFLVATVRYAPFGVSLVRPSIPAYLYDEIALGLGLGRRFYAGPALMDLAVAPTIVTMSEEGDLPADGAGGTDDELRVDLSVRALFGSTRWRPTVTIDIEFAPYALKKPLSAATMLPPFPSWTIGLGAGVAGDLL